MHHPSLRSGAAAAAWHGRVWLLRWIGRNLRNRLVWSLAVIIVASKATTFTVPKVVIFGDVVLAVQCGT